MSGPFLRAWRDARRFLLAARRTRPIAFYVEDAASFAYMEPVVSELARRRAAPIAYLTSDRADPLLDCGYDGMDTYFVGAGSVRTYLFLALEARLLVMTMPGLGTAYLDRSRSHPVRYAYLFHSLVSTHMAYPRGSFDHYDMVLCAGPHHLRELRAAGGAPGAPMPELVEAGYPYLDSLAEPEPLLLPRRLLNEQVVLVAPSWGAHGLLECCGEALLAVLVRAGYRVVVRPHPMSWRTAPEVLRRLVSRFAGARVTFDRGVSNREPLRSADHLISDWSGIAFEYALARERPVLFIDTPRKVRNHTYELLGEEPVEAALRERFGVVVAPGSVREVPALLRQLHAEAAARAPAIRAARDAVLFHPGKSARTCADALLGLHYKESACAPSR